MVFDCQLVNVKLYSSNHLTVKNLVNGNYTLTLERDTSYNKCKHAIKVIFTPLDSDVFENK